MVAKTLTGNITVMKKIFIQYLLAPIALLTVLSACERDSDYVVSTPSPYVSNLDLRKLYHGADVTLTREVTRQAYILAGQVTSDHSGKNLPEGLLFVQNNRKVSASIDSLRGIAIHIGADAAKYVPGDSVHIQIEGGVLKRVNGILQITGLSGAQVEKVATGITPFLTPVSALTMLAKPENFEGLLGVVYNSNFEPNIGVERIEGVKVFNEGSGDVEMHVSSTASFKSEFLPYSANIMGIIIPSATTAVPQVWPRVKSDFVATSIVVDPSVPLGPHPAIITGYFADPDGTDANHEYIQLMATQDLDFRRTPFAVVTTNNAGASTPTGPPTGGWATGGLRTYKFNITRGTVSKGTFFYVGGYKLIAGANSTDISKANWVVSKLYSNDGGDDGIGDKTSNLLANSGNAAGMAVFATTAVDLNTVPSDVAFYAGTGNAFASGAGYAICDNDFYSRYHGDVFQPFYREGSNTGKVAANPAAAQFTFLGGEYDAAAKKWTVKRASKTVGVPKTSDLKVVQEMPGATKVVN